MQPTYIGKPNRNMVDVISAQTGVPNAQICCVGDRIYTDIAVAVNAGAQSVLVMSGETDEAILKASDVDVYKRQLDDHGDGAAQEVAEVVGEVGIDAGDEQLVGEVAVTAERELAQEVIAQRVHTCLLYTSFPV